MHLPILTDIVVILGLSVLILLLFQRLKLPSILGFLITGIVAGPYGLSLTTNVHDVEMLAEIGIIFLLFIIGIEFSLKTLSSIKTTVLIGGSLRSMPYRSSVSCVSSLRSVSSGAALCMRNASS